MLKIQNLTKMYAGAAKPSVDNISFEVHGGEIFGFIGPNGAGKSTTIKCMSGIISMTEGDVCVDGKSMRHDAIGAKKNIGYVSDDHALYEGLTGAEYVNFIADIFKVSSAEREQRLARLTEMFSLTDAMGKQISTYSHGMKQKLNIIGALIHEPKVWILDEPMTGLDPRSAYNLKQLMREHADKGNCVFFSSHVLEVVEKVCDRIGIIDGGHLITVCTMEELRARNVDKSLEELFLKLTDDEFSDRLYSGEAKVSDAVKQDARQSTTIDPCEDGGVDAANTDAADNASSETAQKENVSENCENNGDNSTEDDEKYSKKCDNLEHFDDKNDDEE